MDPGQNIQQTLRPVNIKLRKNQTHIWTLNIVLFWYILFSLCYLFFFLFPSQDRRKKTTFNGHGRKTRLSRTLNEKVGVFRLFFWLFTGFYDVVKYQLLFSLLLLTEVHVRKSILYTSPHLLHSPQCPCMVTFCMLSMGTHSERMHHIPTPHTVPSAHGICWVLGPQFLLSSLLNRQVNVRIT